MTNALHLDESNFEKELAKAAVPVVVDFWASWCGPCQMMGPVFEELAGEYKKAGTAILAKLSTEDSPDIASKHGVRGIPTLAVFYKGKEIDRIVGFAPKTVLKAKIDAALTKAK
jgi:thioredoxin 1